MGISRQERCRTEKGATHAARPCARIAETGRRSVIAMRIVARMANLWLALWGCWGASENAGPAAAVADPLLAEAKELFEPIPASPVLP